jgi:RNA polymerase-binding transcription factor DksA
VGNLSNTPVEDRADLGFDNSSEEATIGLVENASARLQEIDAALHRIDAKTFGSCTECGQEISISRLQTAPFVPQCIECARKAQQGEPVSPGNL